MYTAGKPAASISRALRASYAPGATTGSGFAIRPRRAEGPLDNSPKSELIRRQPSPSLSPAAREELFHRVAHLLRRLGRIGREDDAAGVVDDRAAAIGAERDRH